MAFLPLAGFSSCVLTLPRSKDLVHYNIMTFLCCQLSGNCDGKNEQIRREAMLRCAGCPINNKVGVFDD